MKMKLTARLMARVHLALALVWAVLTIPTLLWWKNSILWVSLMSIYAIVISHLAAYSAAHAEKAASQALNESGEANKKITAQNKEAPEQ
ncbi:monooxygenase [Enterobacteriaceae bacterium A-F18]|jgi:flagellar basal body-associated protein FliL|nr:monooxygenase [Phytobacter diazotrophicus]AUV02990.1 monooxygenase [Enterobacteriaceae bacterium ENNIH1]MDU7133800.1 monooxygenase [Enterobacteriaceae bacterium]QIH65595.1 monooxygenase [Enterobacteriaceae bacterium A-F18]MDU4356725.1 monooxygenase [Phytobacter diazotrophicus]MDU7201011.1 monooxygenase [Enterobacteriaceae bacterium]